MAKADYVEDSDSVNLELSVEEATLIMMVLGRFNHHSSGSLSNVYDELVDLGLEPYNNVYVINQSHPTLILVAETEQE